MGLLKVDMGLGGQATYLVKVLTIKCKILAYLLSYNIMPKCNTMNEIHLSDICFMDELWQR